MEQIKIMVVDDEPFIREMMQEFLTLHGHDVITARSGEDAMTKIFSNDPHLVLLDIWMPGMTGLEVLEKIKKSGQNVGVVMLSAFGDEDTVEEALNMGANYYLQKPIEFKKLLKIINKWILSEGTTK
jgi:DNA-binding response OmpR family regulator